MILPKRYAPTGVSSGGGMGDIIECTDVHLERPVVLKMLKDGEESRRLIDEQKVLIQLRSKHVVQLYDVITVQDGGQEKTALVLEHIEGRDLGVGSVERGKAHLFTLWQIACGLLDIHRQGVIHRDIKPNNIRYDTDDVIKILDFGLSRNTGTDAQTSSIIGTPGYMAPELFRSKDISFDQAIDVFAFGVMSLTLVDNNVPAELLALPPGAVPPGSFSTLLPDLPADVVSALESCVNTNPQERPTMEHVEAVLRRHLLFNRHRALVVLQNATHELSAASPNIRVKSEDVGSIEVNYNGLQFIVTALSGSVYVNNSGINVGDELPNCCVLTFGPPNRPRRFVTFDVSNPEVMP
ncbi:serine/threonine-protein kinase [Desulfuromonas thiophila]|uniref:Serine/threonine protein kinase n=1 Tax=Desulfuromonas thiophila TaxID=57664 RepID=A0A1G7DEF7_9BACT|nr:serine/threonine-protein kinase [Desulfuromonas thiophila]SDE49420.1 Serine/threonine protein kinase [Desulfuromonas thiophila]